MEHDTALRAFYGLGMTCKFSPWLISLSEDGDLRIVIGAIAGKAGDALPNCSEMDEETGSILRRLFQGKRPFPPVAGGQTYETPFPHYWYEIVFPNYITYQIRNESYCTYDPDEIRHGRYLLTFERSVMLSHMEQTIDIPLLRHAHGIDHWTHYGIYTSDHIIDVISPDAPRITVLGEAL